MTYQGIYFFCFPVLILKKQNCKNGRNKQNIRINKKNNNVLSNTLTLPLKMHLTLVLEIFISYIVVLHACWNPSHIQTTCTVGSWQLAVSNYSKRFASTVSCISFIYGIPKRSDLSKLCICTAAVYCLFHLWVHIEWLYIYIVYACTCIYVILYLYIFSDVCKMFDLNKIEPLYINVCQLLYFFNWQFFHYN